MRRDRMIRWGAAAVLAGLAVALFTTDAEARGRFRRGGGCGYDYSCYSACWNPCVTVNPCAQACWDPCGGYVTAYGGFNGSGCSGCTQAIPSTVGTQTFHEGDASTSPSNIGAPPTPPPPGPGNQPGNQPDNPPADNPPAGAQPGGVPVPPSPPAPKT